MDENSKVQSDFALEVLASNSSSYMQLYFNENNKQSISKQTAYQNKIPTYLNLYHPINAISIGLSHIEWCFNVNKRTSDVLISPV